MNIDKIPAGKNPPQDINVVIEITGTDLARAKDPETGFELLGRAAG